MSTQKTFPQASRFDGVLKPKGDVSQSRAGLPFASIKTRNKVSEPSSSPRAQPSSRMPHEKMKQTAEMFCVIGAGPSGLAAAKNLKQANLSFDCFESSSDVGGIWNRSNPSCAYQTVHLNISKRLMEFTDHPMPAEYPDFLGMEQAHRYLTSYAERFDLYDSITFNTRVRKIIKVGDAWHVWLDDEAEPRQYCGVIVASGHHSDPQMPDIKGTFDGELLHANDYKGPDQLRGKRVLVIGSGNSGLDIACDAAHHAAESHHSIRRGYHIIPKVIFGRPTDMMFEKLKRMRLPRWMVRGLASGVLRIIVGPYKKYGLPEPKMNMFAAHPAASSRYLDLLRNGEIDLQTDVAKFNGDSVDFRDGSSQQFDTVICCTGYKISMPFLDAKWMQDASDTKSLFLNMFHRTDDSLFFVGLFQPADGGFWQLADYQSKLITRYIVARKSEVSKAERFRRLIATAMYDVSRDPTKSEQQKYAVDHYRYRAVVKKMLAKFGPLRDGIA